MALKTKKQGKPKISGEFSIYQYLARFFLLFFLTCPTISHHSLSFFAEYIASFCVNLVILILEIVVWRALRIQVELLGSVVWILAIYKPM